ncbi:potassium voltage-gated channel subfamily A member 6-like isoform X2 [Bolinopsis microptera]
MSNTCRRGTTPFVKSRSIECGMLGSVDRQMKNFMLVNNGEKIVYPSSDRITINVSGKIFETSLVDLNKFPDTLLGNHDARKQYYDIFRDEYYFNRNQIAFDSILYYYQTGGDIYQPEGLPDIVFERELEFFQLIDGTCGESQGESPEPDMTHSQLISQSVGFQRWRSALWGFVEYPKSSIPARIWAYSNILIIVISVINLIWESIPKYRNDTSIETFFHSGHCLCVLLHT